MSDPVTFDSTTARFALPLLYIGQSQKESFVNEALVRTDALLHCSVLGTTATPPASPATGDSWLVATGASGDWAGHDGDVVLRLSGAWTFITPRNGMRVFDISAGQENLFFENWRKATTPVEPLGGTTVDTEARAAITDLVSALKVLGFIPPA